MEGSFGSLLTGVFEGSDAVFFLYGIKDVAMLYTTINIDI